MTLGTTIASYRKKLGITQEALAQQLDVTNQAVSKWESDLSCPDVTLLPKLADIFDISLDELFGRKPKAAAPAENPAPSPEPAPIYISHLPWPDDNTLYAVLYKGHKLMKTQGFGFFRNGGAITLKYEGPALNVQSSFSVQCGDVKGNVDARSHISCGNIEGNANAGSHVECDNVGGNLSAGSHVTCGNVGGKVTAGSHVECGKVTGSVHAGSRIVFKQSE